MQRSKFILGALLLFLATVSCSTQKPAQLWEATLSREVKAMGYGNWIIIADASYPFQEVAGYRTVVADAEIPAVLDSVIQEMEKSQHTRPSFYFPREMRYLTNDQAPGIDLHHEQLNSALHGYSHRDLEMSILENLVSESAQKFSVLVIKTATTLPYSSVFIDLDSGYWDGYSEQELRKRIEASED